MLPAEFALPRCRDPWGSTAHTSCDAHALCSHSPWSAGADFDRSRELMRYWLLCALSSQITFGSKISPEVFTP